MNEYPKRLITGVAWFDKLQEAVYAHERVRLGMIKEIDCPFCPVENSSKEENK